MRAPTALTPDRTTLDLLTAAADEVRDVCGTRIGDLVRAALLRTLTRTISVDETGSVFVITGDIPAMWLRDSTTQLAPYLRFLDRSPWLADLVESVVRRQFEFIRHDPYANSFNDGPTGAHYDAEDLCADPAVWEQKYEVDSLCYPISLAHALWKSTGRTDFVDDRMHQALRAIVAQLRLEQRHDDSSYRFERTTAIPTETLTREGRGSVTAHTGMTWSGFRPSDDACTYGYNIPANLFAAQALLAVAEIADEVCDDPDLAACARALSTELQSGVEKFGIVDAPDGSSIYAYEVDGLGGVLRMDDANTPSLLSLPLIAPDVIDRRIWDATRMFVLSQDNPYWFSGSVLKGVGSPHTKTGRVWPIALAVQGLVGTPADRIRLLRMISDTDAGTGHIHESIDANDPTIFSRPWFSWAESMFCELAMAVVDDVGSTPAGR
ncbi:glycoside hydrolase family 125 protein [Microbacterium murale]|uniref:Meiotically up-regulated gene 157 (Mug157) protein n=1 Tax=Microbacterium murale TaxID=1081040 RepID=A0ABU0P4I1_9MICO|nr:glycoside hydrolase family 125 protein [Microbacterium murale]MDQ0642235.1 meiotically up-regulated gene 157 (Mug157) protein [Microbacterium murale]